MMVRMLLQESRASFRKIAILGIVSGLSSSAMLAILNKAAGKVQSGEINFHGFALFVLALLTSSLTKKISLERTQSIVQNVLRGVRVRIADRIRKTSLISFERQGKESYYVALTRHATQISNCSLSLINAAQSVVIIAACIVYIGWLSLISLGVITVFIALGVALYQFKDNELQPVLLRATIKESRFFALLGHIVSGFKEIALCRRKNDDIFNDYRQICDETFSLKKNMAAGLTETIMFSQAAMYALIALLVIVFPFLKLTPYDVVPQLIVAILFFWTSLENVVAAIPDYFKVTSAIAQLRALENQLQEVEDLSQTHNSRAVPTPLAFSHSLSLDKIGYHHLDADGCPIFSIGPIDLTLNKGQIIFICGGNGSGKTTFMKVLCSLYPAQSGLMYLDDQNIDRDTRAGFRQNFAAVFADYHLFDRLYGLRNINGKKVQERINDLGLGGKITFNGVGFSTTDLSFGQKKRLAILNVLMEERAIYLLDEPAAGFDPHFRQFFYEDFLPRLRAEGKTIIVVTHDDRYFNCCDHIVKLEQGRIREEKRT